RLVAAEGVERQHLVAPRHLEAFERHVDHQDALHRADRAVAAPHDGAGRDIGAIAHRTAMAAALMRPGKVYPHGFSLYHLVITYLSPLRAFIAWCSVAALRLPSGRWLFHATSMPFFG